MPIWWVCADLVVFCADLVVLFSDLLDLCADLLVLCADFVVLCANLVVLSADLVVLCADLVVLCTDFLSYFDFERDEGIENHLCFFCRLCFDSRSGQDSAQFTVYYFFKDLFAFCSNCRI